MWTNLKVRESRLLVLPASLEISPKSNLPCAFIEKTEPVQVQNFSYETEIELDGNEPVGEHIFIKIVSHLDSFRNRGTKELGCGLLLLYLLRLPRFYSIMINSGGTFHAFISLID